MRDREPCTLGTQLFLIRHGEVDRAWQRRIYGALDVPLSPRGREQARTAAVLLRTVPLAMVVSSGLQRTEFGAAELRAGRTLPRIDDPALREIDRGRWAGMHLDDLERVDRGAWERWLRSPATSRPPGGESLQDLAERVLPRLDHWAAVSLGRPAAIIAHAWVIRVAVTAALGLPLDSAPNLELGTGELVALHWCPPEARLFAHAPGPAVVGFALDRLPDPSPQGP